MKKDKQMPWIICGREIGTATGWDQADTFVMQLYNLVGANGYAGPTGDCVSFDFENGKVETYDDQGTVLVSMDLVEAVKDAPRRLASEPT